MWYIVFWFLEFLSSGWQRRITKLERASEKLANKTEKHSFILVSFYLQKSFNLILLNYLNSCSTRVTGKTGIGQKCTKNDNECDLTNTGKLLGKKCRFCPDTLQESGASLMGFHFLDSVSVVFLSIY